MINKTRMTEQLILHEGLRLTAYVDTENKWTIGVGYNITDRGYDVLEEVCGRSVAPRDGMTEKVRLTKEESMKVLAVDIARVEKAVRAFLTPAVYDGLTEPRQRVCVDMAFNMGYGAARFARTIAHVKAGDWSAAGREMYKSKWANQVGDGPGGKRDRADRLVGMILTGNDYTT